MPSPHIFQSTGLLLPSLHGALRSNAGKDWARTHGLEAIADAFATSYGRLTGRERSRYFGYGYAAAERTSVPVATVLASSARAFAAIKSGEDHQRSLARARFRKKLAASSLAEVLAMKPRDIVEEEELRTFLCDIIERCSCSPEPDARPPGGSTPPNAPIRYALKLQKIECRDKQALGFGKDEIYARYIVLDGSGSTSSGVTPIYTMDDGDVRRVNRYIYPFSDPKGFLDATVDLIEDDSDGAGRDAASKVLDAVAKTISEAAKGNLYAQIAAGIAQVAGAIIAAVQPKDDLLDSRSITRTSEDSISSAVGAALNRTFLSSGGDALGETSAHYRATFRMYESA